MKTFNRLTKKEKLEYLCILLIYPLILLYESLGKSFKFLNSRSKQITASILTVCLMLTMIPVMSLTASATTNETKNIMLGTSGISAWNSTDGYDYIYMGSYNDSPIKWRVLDTKTNTGESGLFVLSEKLLGTGEEGDVYFQQHIHNHGGASYYKGDSHQDGTELIANGNQGSDAQSWCNTFETTNLSRTELSAIIATTKSDEEFISTASYSYEIPFAASDNILNGDKVFFLSAEETENSAYGFKDDLARVAYYGENAGVWWLRSPYELLDRSAGCIGGTGWEGCAAFGFVKTSYAARPAFNLNLNSVLFTSAATGGKAVGTHGTLTSPAYYSGSEWKATLLDDTRNFTVAQTAVTAKAGGTVTLDYSGAGTGANEYVSAMIVDESDNVLYYGQIANNSASGEASLTIPAGLAYGRYKLKVFSEQLNGDKMTDYASAFEEITLKVIAYEDTATITGVVEPKSGNSLKSDSFQYDIPDGVYTACDKFFDESMYGGIKTDFAVKAELPTGEYGIVIVKVRKYTLI